MTDLIRKSDALAQVDYTSNSDDMCYAPFLRDRIAAIAALPAVSVGVKPLDLSCVQKHAFLAGVVAARNVPPTHPCSGPLLWLDYDPGDNPALARILAALEPVAAPDPAAIREAALREAAAIATERWAARREHADHLAELDYPEAMIDAKTVSAKADEAEMIAEQILALIQKGAADDRA